MSSFILIRVIIESVQVFLIMLGVLSGKTVLFISFANNTAAHNSSFGIVWGQIIRLLVLYWIDISQQYECRLHMLFHIHHRIRTILSLNYSCIWTTWEVLDFNSFFIPVRSNHNFCMVSFAATDNNLLSKSFVVLQYNHSRFVIIFYYLGVLNGLTDFPADICFKYCVFFVFKIVLFSWTVWFFLVVCCTVCLFVYLFVFLFFDAVELVCHLWCCNDCSVLRRYLAGHTHLRKCINWTGCWLYVFC